MKAASKRSRSRNEGDDRRAIAIRQPYAWLVVNGIKDIENRNNPPPEARVGKRLYIHATKKRVTAEDFSDFLATVKKLGIRNYPKAVDDFQYGAIIGSVVLLGSTRSSKSRWANRGLCHWQLGNAKKMSPIYAVAKQGLFYRF